MCGSGRGSKMIAGVPILLVARRQSRRVDDRTRSSATRKSLFCWARSVRRRGSSEWFRRIWARGGGFRTSVRMIKPTGQGNVGKVMKIMSRLRQPTSLHACTRGIGDVQRMLSTLDSTSERVARCHVAGCLARDWDVPRQNFGWRDAGRLGRKGGKKAGSKGKRY